MLTYEQEKAIRILTDRYSNKEKISILQGIAGSGKSYTLAYLIDYLNISKHQVKFATYTGTAAKILKAKNLNASTVHQLIYNPIIINGYCVGFEKKSKYELQNLKLIVIDEFSMLPQDLLEDLISYNIPIILVGDRFQLPPIGQPNIFLNSAHAVLTEPQRQALDNPILWAANEVRLGNPLKEGIYGNVLLVGRRKDLKEEWYRKDVQFIAGLNATRNTLNFKIANTPVPIVGSKIVFLKNDHKHFITNGTLAEIHGLRKYNQIYYLDFFTDDDLLFENYSANFQEQTTKRNQYFDFGYCLTAHKAQGATYDSPGVIFDESYYFKEYRNNWLYSAITRFTGNYSLAIIR